MKIGMSRFSDAIKELWAQLGMENVPLEVEVIQICHPQQSVSVSVGSWGFKTVEDFVDEAFERNWSRN